MTFKEFLSILKENKIPIYQDKRKKTGWGYYLSYGWNHQSIKEYIRVSWSTGGISGGSCYGQDSHQSYSNDDYDDTFYYFDKILEIIWPNITYLNYKHLEKELVHKISWSENEYYGNSTNYCGKYVILVDMFNMLIDLQIIEGEKHIWMPEPEQAPKKTSKKTSKKKVVKK